MNVYRATVTPVGGNPIEVEYDANAQQPMAAAIAAAAKAVGIVGFPQAPTVVQHRSGGPWPASGGSLPTGFGPRVRVHVGECNVWVRLKPSATAGETELVPDRCKVADLAAAPGMKVIGDKIDLVDVSVSETSLTCKPEVIA